MVSRLRWCSPKNLEIARFAASLVRVEYEEKSTSPTCIASVMRPSPGKSRKSAREPVRAAKAARRGRAGVRRSRGAPRRRYYSPIEHHNPMELYASTVVFEQRRQADGLRQDPGRAERSTLSMWRAWPEVGAMCVLCRLLWEARSVPDCARNIRWSWPLLAARALRRSVRVVLTRPADVWARLPACHDPAASSSARPSEERSTRPRTTRSR